MSKFDYMGGREAAASIIEALKGVAGKYLAEARKHDGDSDKFIINYVRYDTLKGAAEGIEEKLNEQDEEPDTFTFTVEGDVDDLLREAKDINVRKCPWFGLVDKYGNHGIYIRGDYGEDTGYLVMDVPEDWDVDYVIISNGSGPLATMYRKEDA